MHAQQQLAAFSIDLTRLHRRTITSFYSNLVTRPTGRAVRMGVEQQLLAVGRGEPCVSILDFSQVRVLDYSCADEIVAKLLLRYAERDRPVDAYFIARGLQDHHLESVEAVLERHTLLLATEEPGQPPRLLGPCEAAERSCWSALVSRGRARISEMMATTGLTQTGAAAVIQRFVSGRVAVELPDGVVAALAQLNDA